MRSLLALVFVVFMTAATSLFAQENSSSTAEAELYIISPKNGDTLTSPITVKFGLKGMGVAPAGIDKANTGHHHLLVDGKALPALDKPLGGEVIHFGGGQTETALDLQPGEHTLQLILGDKNHQPHQPPVVSEKTTITIIKLPHQE